MSENLSEAQQLELVQQVIRQRSADDFMLFCRSLIVPSAFGPRLFEAVMADFQEETFLALTPSLHALKHGEMPPRRRFWIERTKKSSKDSDLAIVVIWLMAYTQRPLLIQVCAANSEQAGIVENRARSLLHYNPWLNEHIEVIERQIRSTENPKTVLCRIEATGSAGAAQGPTPDLLILNELVHVDKWEVMEAHANNADGVPQGVVIVSTNAGVKGTRAHTWRKNAIANPDRWSCHIRSSPAPWISKDDMEDARRRDPIGTEYARLWEGRWVSGMGDAISEDDIEACFVHEGPLTEPEPGWIYVAGLDLGVSRDHSAIAVVGVEVNQQRIRLAHWEAWEPSIPNDSGKLEVDSKAVEDAALRLSKLFRIEDFRYDPAAGGSFMAQSLRRKGVRMREQTFSNIGMTEMAQCLVGLTKARRLECFDDPENRLRRDFGKFHVSHKPPSKYKLEAVRDEFGHADVGTALVISLPSAVDMIGGLQRLKSGDVIALFDDEELTSEEIDALPDELREIFDLHDDLEREWNSGDDWIDRFS